MPGGALTEELDELREARTPGQKREELGDAMFALANLARQLDIDAEGALRSTSRGFAGVFQLMEEIVKERGIDLRQIGIEEKLKLWEEAKSWRD